MPNRIFGTHNGVEVVLRRRISPSPPSCRCDAHPLLEGPLERRFRLVAHDGTHGSGGDIGLAQFIARQRHADVSQKVAGRTAQPPKNLRYSVSGLDRPMKASISARSLGCRARTSSEPRYASVRWRRTRQRSWIVAFVTGSVGTYPGLAAIVCTENSIRYHWRFQRGAPPHFRRCRGLLGGGPHFPDFLDHLPEIGRWRQAHGSIRV
jgi:hypothetical protein